MSKSFNLEDFKKGHKALTRDGRYAHKKTGRSWEVEI